MPRALFVVFLIAISPVCDAQCFWSVQNPRPVSSDLRDVCFFQGAVGWAVGDDGVILHSSDSGSTWIQQKSNTDKRLTRVVFPDAIHGWAIGIDGVILRTGDGGASWTLQTSGTTSSLWDIHAFDASNAVVVGADGTILKTADAGTTWNRLVSNTEQHLYGVAAFDTRTIMAVGDPIVLRSLDEGTTWSSISGPSLSLRAAHALDTAEAYVGDNHGALFRTTDRGATWDKWTVMSGQVLTITSAGATILAVGPLEGIQSTNRGSSWKKITAPGMYVFSATLVEGGACCAVGIGGHIYLTSDKGVTWRDVTTGGIPTLTAVCESGNQSAVAVGNGNSVLFLSADRNAWRLVHAGDWVDLTSVSFVDSVTGWVAGTSCIRKTTDGGRTWINQSDSAKAMVSSIHFVSATTGWACGVSSNGILATTDGGNHWNRYSTGREETMDLIRFVDERRGWVVGPSFRTLYSNDGGVNWTVQDSGTEYTFPKAISCVDVQTVWVGGYQGILRRTTDGGGTWTTMPVPVPKIDIHSLYFSSDRSGWIAGTAGLYRTSDAGATWRKDDDFRGPTLAATGSGAENSWAVGNSGYVLRRDCTTRAEGPIPALTQSFELTVSPNPFGASCAVVCTFHETASVSAEVYNLLGRRVATLYNGITQTGTHTWYFDAHPLPGGVYRVLVSAVTRSGVEGKNVAVLHVR